MAERGKAQRKHSDRRNTFHSLAVREFVERTRCTGNLYDRVLEPVSREEGAALHRQRQAEADGDAEVLVHQLFQLGSDQLELKGRIDLLWQAGSTARIEEIKVSRLPPLTLQANENEAHWGQLESYAALLAMMRPLAFAL